MKSKLNLGKIALVAIVLLATTFSYSQKPIEWKEKDNFHQVMSQTFHPMESGNFNPIKERSQEMYDKAVAWQKSTVPSDVNKKKATKVLKNLVKASKALNEKIKAGTTDEVIKTDLTKLHDIFHQLVEMCMPKE